MAIEKYQAKRHALRVNQRWRELAPEHFCNTAEAPVLLLASPRTVKWPFCDQTQPFRQNRNFYYLSGCDLPDSYVTYDTSRQTLVLYLPPVDADEVMWSGRPISVDEAKSQFDVDDVRYSNKLANDLALLYGKRTVFTVEQLIGSDHAQVLGELPNIVKAVAEADSHVLEALEESRMIKDEYELGLMRQAAAISDNAHLKVMSTMNIHTNETHIHAEFVYHSLRAGSKNQSYDPICCSGHSCSTLHYVKNDEDLAGRQLILIDAGAEWKNYASDVTRTYPINGEWTMEAREIYDLVLDMQTSCEKLVAPGASWEELHLLAHKILVKGFLKLGIFKGGSEEEILESRVSSAFFPHGLGHMLGMDTHDTGGRANYSDPDPMFRYLRIRRNLEPGMVVTVEPGIYFSPFLINPCLRGDDGLGNGGKFIDTEVLDKYWDVGGIRIEDDVLVTLIGHENFTKVPKDPDVLSAIIKKTLSAS
ncbi:peptidase M24, structural domain-containing protein [Lipomyces tetrasporus]|uniref:Peptidase M24, structural domain-containing protein n=1 Tax=Lipomyces tetrasporus TaxID=54092 RepID=A0AAD7QTM1_9ASCO|nr:peptidase M24, structural domain-containing protein [Lipomyces tetrasporus]KAJ8101277.1 peptidase M24, structural domain-containing protein [Lipomyces tetrasporus]